MRKTLALGLSLLSAFVVGCDETESNKGSALNPRTTHYAFVQIRGNSMTFCAEVERVNQYYDAVRKLDVTEIDSVGNVVPVVGSFERPTQCEILESEGKQVPYYVVDGAVMY